MELQTLYKASSLFIKSLLLPHQTPKKDTPQNGENTQQTSPFTQKAFRALEYGHGYLDGLNPLTPTLEGIQKSLNIEPYSNSSSEYLTGKQHGALTGLTLDAALTISGGSMMGGAGTCEVSTLGVCTPVAAPAAAVGAVAASSGVLMSVGHGNNLVTSSAELHRLGNSKESASRLGRKAQEAEEHTGIHGVSTSEKKPQGEIEFSSSKRNEVEKHFKVHDTPTRNDSTHKTIELPKPVTQGIADIFNKIFGRIK